jgi:hypothetical protein
MRFTTSTKVTHYSFMAPVTSYRIVDNSTSLDVLDHDGDAMDFASKVDADRWTAHLNEIN